MTDTPSYTSMSFLEKSTLDSPLCNQPDLESTLTDVNDKIPAILILWLLIKMGLRLDLNDTNLVLSWLNAINQHIHQ